MKPIIRGLSEPMTLEVSQLERIYVDKVVTFECPSCGYIMRTDLSHGDPLEYGSFYSPSECQSCNQEFEEIEWEVSAVITIKEKT